MSTGDILLENGTARLRLDPACGGSIAAYWEQRSGGVFHWLRPAPEPRTEQPDPGAMASFPLVPYSNRIRHGTFRFRGREISLPLNFGGHPHSIHGHGWQAPWTEESRTEAAATLAYHHVPGAWPFEYRATQQFRLEPGALSVAMTLENLSGKPMPAGLGFHPYFPRTPGTRLTAAISQVWLTDREVMPTRRIAPPPEWDLNRGLPVDRIALDNAFTGWKRSAVIEWPERQARLGLSGSEDLRFLVVYTPRGQPFFCAEPVSHCTDAFNRAEAGEEGTGMRVLAPGESWTVSMELRPECLA